LRAKKTKSRKRTKFALRWEVPYFVTFSPKDANECSHNDAGIRGITPPLVVKCTLANLLLFFLGLGRFMFGRAAPPQA
jgi:hypothetical protein